MRIWKLAIAAWIVAILMLVVLAREVCAQSAASPLMMAREQFFNASGVPLAYGKVYTYVTGTSTPQATYTDATANPLSVNTNPIILDAGGYASIYVKCSDPPYKIVVKNSAGVTQWTEDGVQYPGCNGVGVVQSLNGLTVGTQLFGTGTSGVDFNIQSDIDTHIFNLPDASSSARGVVNTGAQSFSGSKSFLGDVDVSTLSISGPDTVFAFDELDCSTVTPQPGQDIFCADGTANGMKVSNNGGAFGLIPNSTPVAVGDLPTAAAGNKGWIMVVNDSTAIVAEGQTCANGGTDTALAFSNGSVWKCF